MKYELTNNTKDHFGTTLYQIKALKDFGDVKAGDLGGWVASEKNLSQEGNCWVYDNAKVFDNVLVSGDAEVFDNAKVCGAAKVSGNAMVSGDTKVFDNAMVFDNARVYGTAKVFGDAIVCGNAMVFGDARIFSNAVVSGDVRVSGVAKVYGNVRVSGDVRVFGDAEVHRGHYSNTPISITRSDGYTFTLQSDMSILAGCRDFTPEEVDAHWGNPSHHKHKESWAIVQALRTIHNTRN